MPPSSAGRYLSMGEAVKAVVDGQHVVTLDDAHPDSCTHGCIHPSTGSADIYDGHIDVTLTQGKDG